MKAAPPAAAVARTGKLPTRRRAAPPQAPAASIPFFFASDLSRDTRLVVLIRSSSLFLARREGASTRHSAALRVRHHAAPDAVSSRRAAHGRRVRQARPAPVPHRWVHPVCAGGGRGGVRRERPRR